MTTTLKDIQERKRVMGYRHLAPTCYRCVHVAFAKRGLFCRRGGFDTLIESTCDQWAQRLL